MDNTKKRIMLVEDEDFIRDLYKRQISLAGFDIDAFSNGKEGILASQQNHYDLALLDIMLPDINGLEILRTLKTNEKTKNIPVVLLTNLGQESVLKEGEALGALGHLIKASYTPNQIVDEIKKILAKQDAAEIAQ